MNLSTTLAPKLNSLTTMVLPPHLSINGTDAHGGEGHQPTEGGFLSGRNPFIFQESAPLPTFIVQLLVIVVFSRIVKIVLNPIRQPSVIAETISGIILGPTAMGRLPHFTEWIFPKPSLPFLNLMSNFGLVLFLFLVGLELDPRMLRKSIKNSIVISVIGMVFPFILSLGTSYFLYEMVEPESYKTGFWRYTLFPGVAMAVTAFPVLARILTELNLLKTKVGGITISAAAVGDALCWCLLALVISLVNAGSALVALYTFLLGLGYSLILMLIVRPIFVYFLRRAGAFERVPSQYEMFFALMIVFISAFITDAIGIHAIFGGFLAGIIMPHEGGFAYHITEKLEDTVAIVFLPLYFALSGLKTAIGALDTFEDWGIVVLVIFIACVGKVVGCTLAGRISNMNWRESLTVGTLMNCKGLVELIVLNLGYDAGVISKKTFAIMVIMALVTTFITVPVVAYLYPPQYHEKPEESVEGEDKKKKKPDQPSLLLSVNRMEQVLPILGIVRLLQLKLSVVPAAEKKLRLRKLSQESNVSLADVLLTPSGISSTPDKPPVPDKSFKVTTGLTINVLRLIELTERDSSVMLETSTEALKDDPIAKIIRAYCELHKTSKQHNKVQSLVKVVTMQKFGEAMVKSAEDVLAKYILIPWSGSGSIIEDPATRYNQAFTDSKRRRYSLHTSSQHANFIEDLLAGAKSTVLIFVERGLETPAISREALNEDEVEGNVISYKKIFFPFFGGKDDREALEIVMSLNGVKGAKIYVVRYRSEVDRRSSGVSVTESVSAELQDSVVPSQVISMEGEDDEVIHQYFGTSESRKVFDNIHFHEVVSFSPVTTALTEMAKLEGSDLVILGRGNLRLQGQVNLKNENVERRKVLGDLAEAFMLTKCDASLLLVQGQKS